MQSFRPQALETVVLTLGTQPPYYKEASPHGEAIKGVWAKAPAKASADSQYPTTEHMDVSAFR